jgi:hypothetical protein
LEFKIKKKNSSNSAFVNIINFQKNFICKILTINLMQSTSKCQTSLYMVYEKKVYIIEHDKPRCHNIVVALVCFSNDYRIM